MVLSVLRCSSNCSIFVKIVAVLAPGLQAGVPMSTSQARWCSGTSSTDFSENQFHAIASEALETLQDQLDALVESKVPDGDVSLEHGTYVLNKQAPNRQIWSSSPVSGPARYDWVDGHWIYKRDGHELFEHFSSELSELLREKVTLSQPQ